jgi:hypothetical protein
MDVAAAGRIAGDVLLREDELNLAAAGRTRSSGSGGHRRRLGRMRLGSGWGRSAAGRTSSSRMVRGVAAAAGVRSGGGGRVERRRRNPRYVCLSCACVAGKRNFCVPVPVCFFFLFSLESNLLAAGNLGSGSSAVKLKKRRGN